MISDNVSKRHQMETCSQVRLMMNCQSQSFKPEVEVNLKDHGWWLGVAGFLSCWSEECGWDEEDGWMLRWSNLLVSHNMREGCTSATAWAWNGGRPVHLIIMITLFLWLWRLHCMSDYDKYIDHLIIIITLSFWSWRLHHLSDHNHYSVHLIMTITLSIWSWPCFYVDHDYIDDIK